jgi:hypothetical protein
MNTPISTTDLIVLVGVVTTSIVTIINAWKGNADRRELSLKADRAGRLADVATSDSAIAVAGIQAAITARSDLQDQKLDEIHEATNGGVQALRDKVVIANGRIDALETLLKTAVAELRAERAKA